MNNLRRRVEAYGTDLWESVVKDEPGRKKYQKNGETYAERWSGVDDLVLVAGATRLGLLNKKAGKALEMINWMRNHASPAHDGDHKVEQEDVIGLALIVQKNLFEAEMPDPGHSVSTLFEPVKNKALNADKLKLLSDQIRGLKAADLRVVYGFLLDLLCKGEAPALDNVEELLPVAWEKAPEELRKTTGERYHGLFVDPSSDTSADRGASARVLDFLIGSRVFATSPTPCALAFIGAAQKNSRVQRTLLMAGATRRRLQPPWLNSALGCLPSPSRKFIKRY